MHFSVQSFLYNLNSDALMTIRQILINLFKSLVCCINFSVAFTFTIYDEINFVIICNNQADSSSPIKVYSM